MLSLFMTCLAFTNINTDKVLLERLVSSHRSARESIASIQCEIEQKSSDSSSPLSLRGMMWKIPEGYRIKIERLTFSTYQDRIVDSLFVDGKSKQLIRRNRGMGSETVLVKSSMKMYQDLGNPYRHGLLTFIGPADGNTHKLEDLITLDAFTNIQVSSSKPLATEVIELKLVHKNGYFLITFDEKYNYLATHAVYSIKDDSIRSLLNIEEFTSLKPGVYFPTRIVLNNEIKGKIKETVEAKYRIINGNQPINNAVLQLIIPSGTLCNDRVTKTYYKVDSNGNQIGPLLDPQGKTVVSTLIATATEKIASPGLLSPIGQSSVEAHSWTNLVLFSSVVLIFGGLIMIVFSRWRSRKSED